MLQCMALGIPVVASSIGTPAEIIGHGVSGLLAGNDREWADALTALVDDPALRSRLGRSGRALVEARFSSDLVGSAFARELRAAAGLAIP